jgi:hypothetical protein
VHTYQLRYNDIEICRRACEDNGGFLIRARAPSLDPRDSDEVSCASTELHQEFPATIPCMQDEELKWAKMCLTLDHLL